MSLNLMSLVGRTIDGKYRLDALLGQGGMGAVFRATHGGTDRVVALKLIQPGLMEQEEFVERFQREARATGRLRHPNIVDLTDFGFAQVDSGKVAYLVMEYLEGSTLAEALKSGEAQPLEWVVKILGQVCSALQEAHEHGILHRDLKPDNIWLEPDRRGGFNAKILDFGLAKLYDPKVRSEGGPGLPTEGAATVALTTAGPRQARHLPRGAEPTPGSLQTELGTVLGTPAYMSPEQCRGLPVDPRSDIYSLGVMAYQMLSGQTPFMGNSMELINAHIQKQIPPLGELNPRLPPTLANLVMECLEKDPDLRPPNMETLGNRLEGGARTRLAEFQEGLAWMASDPVPFIGFPAMVWAVACLPALGLILEGAALKWGMTLEFPLYLAFSLVGLWVFGLMTAWLLVSHAGIPWVIQKAVFPQQKVEAWKSLQRMWPALWPGLRRNLLNGLLFLPYVLAWIAYPFWVHFSGGERDLERQLDWLFRADHKPWVLGVLLAYGLSPYLMSLLTFKKDYGLNSQFLPAILVMEGLDPEGGKARSKVLEAVWKQRSSLSRTKLKTVLWAELVGLAVMGILGVVVAIFDFIPDPSLEPLKFVGSCLVAGSFFSVIMLGFLLAGVYGYGRNYLQACRLAGESMTRRFADYRQRMEKDSGSYRTGQGAKEHPS